MRAVLTVIGKDKVGIIAGVSQELAKFFRLENIYSLEIALCAEKLFVNLNRKFNGFCVCFTIPKIHLTPSFQNINLFNFHIFGAG